MQEGGGVDVKCMENNFSGHGVSGYGVMVPFCFPSKTTKISLRTIDYSPWGSKNRIGQKFLQVKVDVKCMETNFGRYDQG